MEVQDEWERFISYFNSDEQAKLIEITDKIADSFSGEYQRGRERSYQRR